MNQIKTLILLATLTALLLFVGQALAGRGGFMIALMFAGVMNFAAYWWSDKIVLRMYGAQEIDQAQAPDLFALVRGLAQRAQILRPGLRMRPYDNIPPGDRLETIAPKREQVVETGELAARPIVCVLIWRQCTKE